MTDLLLTPLASAHEALQAKMVPFAGWLMPVQYEGILAEHAHTRAAAGLFDLSHMGRVSVRGEGAEALLQYATTNDLTRLEEGRAQYSLLCSEQGRVLEDLLVYRLPDEWRLVVNASNRERVLEHLAELAGGLGYDASVTDDTARLALLGLQGPLSEEVLQPLVDGDLSTLGYYHARWMRLVQDRRSSSPADAGVTVLMSRTGYTGEDGFEITVDAAPARAVWDRLLADERVRPVGLGARDTLRLEAGMALYGHELSEDVTPYEAGLGRVVKPDKGPFVGRGALLELHSTPPPRRLTGLLFDPGAIPRQGCPVRRDGELVGEIVSGTFSPTLRRPIATAYLRADATEPGSQIRAAVRESVATGRVVSLPFVPHRTKRRIG